MTKRELVLEVSAKLRFTQNEVTHVVQTMLDTISDILSEGGRFEIRNFGVFEVKTRGPRIGRNPRTGQQVIIARKRIVTFRPGKTLREWIGAGPGHAPKGLFQVSHPPAAAETSPSTPGAPQGGPGQDATAGPAAPPAT